MVFSPVLWLSVFILGTSASVFRRGASSPNGPTLDGPKNEPPFRADAQLTFRSADGGAKPQTINIEIPETFTKFMEGLMWRKNLADDQGMIFAWDQDGPRGFWMENTLIGLDIVYANSNKQIVSVVQGEPLSLKSLPSAMPATYAIEVPLGWFEKHGFKVGDLVDFEFPSADHYVASDAPNFGATDEEVRLAEEAGVYQR
mmetsp:Transcript_11756/g.26233  ORF Transcript_11756/g.26233 Transcript_11756/m.26233 type:complete len:200 (+) Transcript_11756:61-660(+)